MRYWSHQAHVICFRAVFISSSSAPKNVRTLWCCKLQLLSSKCPPPLFPCFEKEVCVREWIGVVWSGNGSQHFSLLKRLQGQLSLGATSWTGCSHPCLLCTTYLSCNLCITACQVVAARTMPSNGMRSPVALMHLDLPRSTTKVGREGVAFVLWERDRVLADHTLESG